MSICQIEERLAGRAYPRTCPTCRLGHCHKGLGQTQLLARAEAAEAKLAVASEMASLVEDLRRSFDTEYDGRMYEECSDCCAILSDGKPHYEGCSWERIDALILELRGGVK